MNNQIDINAVGHFANHLKLLYSRCAQESPDFCAGAVNALDDLILYLISRGCDRCKLCLQAAKWDELYGQDGHCLKCMLAASLERGSHATG